MYIYAFVLFNFVTSINALIIRHTLF